MATPTKQVLGKDLALGMRYWNCGAEYQIDEIIYEPDFSERVRRRPGPGRYFVRSHWVGGWNPHFFNDDFNSGLREDLTWTITCEKAA